MFNNLVWFAAFAAAWGAMGFVLSIVMGRRGHDTTGWFVVGTLLGPFGVLLALDAGRHGEQQEATHVAGGSAGGGVSAAGTGPVDALVGYDGSRESAAALDTVVEMLGERLGRLAVATVVPFGDIGDDENLATQTLQALADRMPRQPLDLDVLHGHPSAALRQRAVERGYDLIAVGARGKGISEAILGSAASELARDSKIPVLVVGGAQQA